MSCFLQNRNRKFSWGAKHFFQTFPSSRCSIHFAHNARLATWRAAWELLRFELSEVNDLMRAFQADGATRLGTACDWLKANEARWKGWIPDPTLCTLANGELYIASQVLTFNANLKKWPRLWLWYSNRWDASCTVVVWWWHLRWVVAEVWWRWSGGGWWWWIVVVVDCGGGDDNCGSSGSRNKYVVPDSTR